MSEGPDKAAADARLAMAMRVALVDHPDGFEAGPKALLTFVQSASSEFASVGIQKFKKELAKVKTAIKEEQERERIEAAKPKIGTKENCPYKHGLKRFMTNHGSYLCDTCRVYLPIGAPMWGCRECDWDVCEGRCHPAAFTLTDLQSELDLLEREFQNISLDSAGDVKTQLALVESKVHKFEKTLDGTTAQELVKMTPKQMSEEEARTVKKTLIQGSEALLTKIESHFEALKTAKEDEQPAAEE